MLPRARATSARKAGKKSPFSRIWTAFPGSTGELARLAIDGTACSKLSMFGTRTCEACSLSVDQRRRTRMTRVSRRAKAWR
jgi:hypothetical protein